MAMSLREILIVPDHIRAWIVESPVGASLPLHDVYKGNEVYYGERFHVQTSLQRLSGVGNLELATSAFYIQDPRPRIGDPGWRTPYPLTTMQIHTDATGNITDIKTRSQTIGFTLMTPDNKLNKYIITYSIDGANPTQARKSDITHVEQIGWTEPSVRVVDSVPFAISIPEQLDLGATVFGLLTQTQQNGLPMDIDTFTQKFPLVAAK